MMAAIGPFARTAAVDSISSGKGLPGRRVDAQDGSEPWDEWMLLAQDGDRVAYQALLRAVTPYLRRIARRHFGRAEDAEDAVQEILLAAHSIRHTYEPGRPFKPWLATIANRRCIDLLRRHQHRRHYESKCPEDTQFASPQDGPEEAVARENAADAVRDAIATLPKQQRDAIRMLRLNELSLREAAAQSGRTVGSLKMATQRAMKSLGHSFAKGRPSND